MRLDFNSFATAQRQQQQLVRRPRAGGGQPIICVIKGWAPAVFMYVPIYGGPQ